MMDIIDIAYCFTSFYIALIQVPTSSYPFVSVVAGSL